MKSGATSEPFGMLLGYAPGGVASYSSDYNTVSVAQYPNRSAFRSYVDGIYMGYKWQCVEFARRWTYLNYGHIFDDVAMAYEIFALRSVRDVAANTRLPLNAFANGSKAHPTPGSLLIWDEGGEFEDTGHVAVITDVFDDRLLIAEQNVGHRKWPEGQHYSRELKAAVSEEGEYWVECSYGDAKILGWVTQTANTQHAEPSPQCDKRLFQLRSHHAPPPREKRAWLNIANEDEASYVKAIGCHALSQDEARQTHYFTLSSSAEHALETATNELHSLFMHATDYVLAHDELLEKFNLPKAVIPKIRQSWDNRLNQLITSRFDFALTDSGLKVYEYNCDSASCYMEAGKVQGKWAAHYGITEGYDAGKNLLADLTKAWKKSHAKDLVHILRDDDPEEKYHSLFMREAIKAAGLRAKIIVGLEGLKRIESGDIVDADGEPIRWVWKTWSWETALEQIREECETDLAINTGHEQPNHSEQVLGLSDVLLRDNIMVFEPLWTLIPSNKAILPVLWQLFPNHPNLLNSSFTLTEELAAQGYVSKPIVGRCGANITLFDENTRALATTTGRFADQEKIYQQLFTLPKLGALYVQICSFTAAGVYSGSGTRVDPSRVVNQDSDCLALRFIDDSRFITPP